MIGKRRGLTLMEMMVGIAILSLVGTGLLLSSGQARSRASSQALAERMAEVFRQARETAVASGKPVGVLLPVSSGAPLCDGYALADGALKAEVKRSIRFSSEAPDCYLFVGHWPLGSGQNSKPSPLKGANVYDLNLQTWAPPGDHAVYAYTPLGTLLSNQVEFDGAYHLVACQSATWSSQQVGDVDSARLNAVNHPVTLRLSKTGQVELLPGLASQSGVTLGGVAPITTQVQPPLSPTPRSTNSTPVIFDVEVSPKPEPGTRPTGATATVALDSYLTVQLKMSDADGDSLKVDWEVKVVRAAVTNLPGTFSSPIETHSQIVDGYQISTWEWRPPPGAQAKDQFELTATVTDGHGGTVNVDLDSVLKKIEILEPGTILFVDNQRHGNREIYRMNNDGTNEVRLTYTLAEEAWPQLSPDGTRILYTRNGQLWTMDIQGQDPKRILRASQLPPHQANGEPMESIIASCWSPDATQCAVIARYGGETGGLDVYVCDSDGTNRVRANDDQGLSVTGAVKVAWCFKGNYNPANLSNQYLLFTSPYDGDYFSFPLSSLGYGDVKHDVPPNPPRYITDIAASLDGRVAWIENNQLWIGDYDPSRSRALQGNVIASGSDIAAPSWSPHCDMLVFSRGDRIFRIPPSGGTPRPLTGPNNALEASWGP